jgi:hypothetical protein
MKGREINTTIEKYRVKGKCQRWMYKEGKKRVGK